MTTPRTVLVLGAHGRLGAAASAAFAAAGWRVLAQARRPLVPTSAQLRPLPVGLSDTAALVAAARGAQAVVYAVNPLYTQWHTELLPAARAGMAVASQLGALFMLPGNVYAYGRTMPPLLQESTPERPSTAKGLLRQQLERELAEHPSLRSVVLRAGDFFGPCTGTWIDLMIAKKLAQGRLGYPGAFGVPHAWAYLPDLAQALVALANRHADAIQAGSEGSARPPRHERLHFAGHTLTGQQLLDGLASAAHRLGLPGPIQQNRMPWWPLRLAGLAVPMLRELARMAYLWEVPHALSGGALARAVGPLPSTPLPAALAATLVHLQHSLKLSSPASPLALPA